MRIRMGRQGGVDIVDVRLTEGFDLYSAERLSCCSCREPCVLHGRIPNDVLSQVPSESQSWCKRRPRRLY